jgi:hypothetical protein
MGGQVRIQTSLKNHKNGDICKGVADTLARQKNIQKTVTKYGMHVWQKWGKNSGLPA